VIKVLLFGAAGRMGKLVIEELSEQNDISLVAGVEHPSHSTVGKSIGKARILSDTGNFPESDVWIDFTYSEPALSHVRVASKSGIPIIIASTGFSPDEEHEIEQLAIYCPVLMAQNLSTGVGVMDRLAGDASRLLGTDFDPTLSEIHHAGKRDAPSGTALRLAGSIETGGKKPQITAIRAGNAIGEHQVRFVGRDEELIIIHRAWSRKAFSRGLPRAVQFIVNKKPGLYTISHLYNSK